ncbi:MAG: PQQ-binding-like beta-propeller repeat protein [Verrucomicrobia bacterium]|nr:PQQ-binding-like beta-propeller repeat protein [Verrucomicrobiota bacterium]
MRAIFPFLVLATAAWASGSGWPQFRGPGGSAVADGVRLPLEWSTTKNVGWVVEVPGNGWSSPVVAGNRVFVTTARGAIKRASTGIFGNDYIAELKKQGLPDDEVNKRVIARDIEQTQEVEEISYLVLAFDVGTGKPLWEREVHRGKPFGGRHRKNTYASETPATDGTRLYVSFGGNVGLFCLSLDGEVGWRRTWEPQAIYLDFGTASSPVVHDGRVYVLRDCEGESFLAALDAKTGDVAWTAPRTELAAKNKSGWATPFIWETAQRTEIITIGKGMVVSYGLDGRELWRLRGMTQATPSPAAGGGLLFVGSGSQGENNRPLYAIKPGASGDISLPQGETSGPFVAWFQPRGTPYTGSPLYYRERLYSINDGGMMQVFEAATGREIYRERVGGSGNTFSASPIANDGRIVALNENGTAYVFTAGDKYEQIGQNALGEMSLATPAVADSTGSPQADSTDSPQAGASLIVRTQSKLYRVAEAAR